jgi:hypothetical protein
MKYRNITGLLGAVVLATSGLSLPSHAVTFTPPAGGSPSQSTGGASRGSVRFTPPPKQGQPSQATGGASRGNLFRPAAGGKAPGQATGGASRGTLFKPAAGRPVRMATGGASRGQLFRPVTGRGAPRQAAGGAARGTLFTAGGAPSQAAGGASRASDTATMVGLEGPAALMALLPQTFYGTTVMERPTILVYLPESTAAEAMFSLKDEAGNTLYEMAMPVSGEAGVLPVTLPADAPALEVGKNYQWYLALKVDGMLNPSTPYVDGWIQRLQPTAEVMAALQQPDALKQATAFGASGIWYDCVAALASVRMTEAGSDKVAKNWQELLASVGLQDIVKAPMMAAVDQASL